jgi:hypothetical protein
LHGIGVDTNTQLVTSTQLVMADGTSVVIEKTSHNAGSGALLSTHSQDGIGAQLAQFIGKPFQLVNPGGDTAAMVGAVVQALRGESSGTKSSDGAPMTPASSNPASVNEAIEPTTPKPGAGQ